MPAIRLPKYLAVAILGAVSASTAALSQRWTHSQYLERWGGELTGPIAGYVMTVGKRVAVAARRPDIPLFVVKTGGQRGDRFVFATATPTGIYVRSFALAYLRDEAQLACVLAHEAGHIVVKHSEEAGEIAAEEIEADRLGLNYVVAAGYDPAACLEYDPFWGEGNQRGLKSEHGTSKEEAAARARAKATGRFGLGLRNRDQLFAAIDGLTVWDRTEGGVKAGKFAHPDLGFEFNVPTAYEVHNGQSLVRVAGPGRVLAFGFRRSAQARETYIGNFFRQLTGKRTGLPPLNYGHMTVNGIPATFAKLTTNDPNARLELGEFSLSGRGDLSLIVYQWDPDELYYMLTFTPRGWGEYTKTVSSFRRLSPETAKSHRSQVVKVVSTAAGETLQTLQRRGVENMETFLRYNSLKASDQLRRGQKVRLIVELKS